MKSVFEKYLSNTPKYANQIQIQIFHLVVFQIQIQIQIFAYLNTNTNTYLTPALVYWQSWNTAHWECTQFIGAWQCLSVMSHIQCVTIYIKLYCWKVLSDLNANQNCRHSLLCGTKTKTVDVWQAAETASNSSVVWMKRKFSAVLLCLQFWGPFQLMLP